MWDPLAPRSTRVDQVKQPRNQFRIFELKNTVPRPAARDRWTRMSAVCPRHVRVRDFLIRVRGLKIFHVRGFKIFHVRVRGQGRTRMSADTSVRVHRSLPYAPL